MHTATWMILSKVIGNWLVGAGSFKNYLPSFGYNKDVKSLDYVPPITSEQISSDLINSVAYAKIEEKFAKLNPPYKLAIGETVITVKSTNKLPSITYEISINIAGNVIDNTLRIFNRLNEIYGDIIAVSF